MLMFLNKIHPKAFLCSTPSLVSSFNVVCHPGALRGRVVASQPPHRRRSPSPAARRRQSLRYIVNHQLPQPRSFTVEALCALPHPGPVHSLTSSMCMSHLLTGSDDGYIRDYDIFTALNGKTFLSAPQRHHASVVEGLMKAGQLYCWWENPAPPGMKKVNGTTPVDETAGPAPVYSMAMHSDALWALGGSDVRQPVRFSTVAF